MEEGINKGGETYGQRQGKHDMGNGLLIWGLIGTRERGLFQFEYAYGLHRGSIRTIR